MRSGVVGAVAPGDLVAFGYAPGACKARHVGRAPTDFRRKTGIVRDPLPQVPPRVTDPERPILIVEDDASDVYLIRAALHKAGVSAPLRVVNDPVDAVLYLQGEGRFSDGASFPSPQLMLLDAGVDSGAGLDLLRWTRQRSPVVGLPIVVLMAAKSDRDALVAYDLGANSCVVRPLTPDSLGELVRAVEFCRGLGDETSPVQ